MTAKTLPEITSYIESRIRCLGRANGWTIDNCIDKYAAHIDEYSAIIDRVLCGSERPTTKMLNDLVGHMGISSVYEISRVTQCDVCKNQKKEFLYVIKKQPPQSY